jgi:hypothetical protein
MHATPSPLTHAPDQIYVDRFQDSLRLLIRRQDGSLYVYVGIPETHPLAGHSIELIPLPVHGSLTYGATGTGNFLPVHLYWYGWDYAHQHESFLPATSPLPVTSSDSYWTIERVEQEAIEALESFKALMLLTETILRKATP